MTPDDPTVIVNEADLPGLDMPGEYDAEFDPDTGKVTVTDGPDAGQEVTPNPRAVDAMRRATPGAVVNDAADKADTSKEP